MRCIISLVFLIKLGKIVIVKEEKLSIKIREFFDLKIHGKKKEKVKIFNLFLMINNIKI